MNTFIKLLTYLLTKLNLRALCRTHISAETSAAVWQIIVNYCIAGVKIGAK